MIAQTEETLSIIAGKTVGELQVFLNQILNDNQNYKSLSNVIEQMKHDYANRFVIELLQNSYDAISKGRIDNPSEAGKIKMILLENEDSPSIFYFANTGRSVSDSNFKSLSSLALSDKNPSESVGNKGIGFKSVLQVCRTPQIYSGQWDSERGYSGFCFEFSPEKMDLLAEKIIEMIERQEAPDFDDIFGVPISLKHWPSHQIEELEHLVQRLEAHNENAVRHFFYSEIRHLSPYTLPFPLAANADDPIIRQLGQEGYVTVVRLELNQADALELTKKAMFELDEKSWLFLDYVAELYIEHRDTDGLPVETKKMYKKEKLLVEDGTKLSEVVVTSADGAPATYWRWRKTIGGSRDPEMQSRIRQAASELPGNWKDFDEARLEAAVLKGGPRDNGLIYIYLPTKQPSGLAAHLNAPFYGQMNRGGIDRAIKLNGLLLVEMTVLLLDAVRQVLDLRPPESGDMVVDLLSFSPMLRENEPGQILARNLDMILADHDIELSRWKVLPYLNSGKEREFGSMSELVRLPHPWTFHLFSKENLARELGIRIVSDLSVDRWTALDTLAKHAGVDMNPDRKRKADWAETYARSLRSHGSSITVWQLFYDELMVLVPNPEELKGRAVLLGHDGELHLAGDERHAGGVFLSPFQSGDVEEGEEAAPFAVQIPSFLQHRIAYLNQELDKHKQKVGNRTSDLVKYFRMGSLVEDFRLQTILDKIILPEMPIQLNPVSYGTPKSDQLFELMEWAMNLYYGARGTESYQNRFKRMWLPSRSGWIRASEAYFSANWDGYGTVSHAGRLSRFFEAVKHQDGINRQLLNASEMPPAIRQLEKNQLVAFLEFCGAADYLRLVPAVPGGIIPFKGWYSRYRFTAPAGGYFDAEQMSAYKKAIEMTPCEYEGDFDYELREVLNIDGIKGYEQVSDDAKLLLAGLIVYSSAHWEEGWQWIRIHKMRGEKPSLSAPSLVSVTLKQIAWIPVPADKADTFVFQPLNEAWYVPTADLSASRPNYSFIPYVVPPVAFEMEQEGRLEMFCGLGLSKFKAVDVKEGFKLLGFLAALLTEGKVYPNQMNYLKGHYRTGWDNVLKLVDKNRLTEYQPPSNLLYSKARKVQGAELSHPSDRIYIPDNKKLLVRLEQNPLVSVLLIDSRPGYPDLLKRMYGEALPLLSDLTQSIWVDGAEWSEQLASESDEKLIDGERQWLLPFLLTVATFREESYTYISSIGYSLISSELLNTRIVFCKQVEVSLEDKQSGPLDRTRPLIHASKEYGTIFISEEVNVDWEELATAFAEYLENALIEMPLKHAFSKLDFDLRNVAPDRAATIRALQAIKITEDNFEAVEHALNDNLRWSIERLSPVFSLYGSLEILQTAQIEEEGHLKGVLDRFLPDTMESTLLLKLAKQSANDFQMGQRLFDEFGLPLSAWNEALAGMGATRKTIENGELQRDFASKKGIYKETVYGVLRNEVRSGRHTVEDYVANKTVYEKWQMPESWLTTYWQLPEQVFVSSLAGPLGAMHVNSEIAALVSEKSDLTGIIDELSLNIPDIAVSGYDMRQANQILIRNTLRVMISAFLAYHQASSAETPRVLLTTDAAFFPLMMREGPEERTELGQWEDKDAYVFILDSDTFRPLCRVMPEGIASVRSQAELLLLLQIQESDLQQAEQKLEQEKEKAQRARRTTNILGRTFDTDESNLHQLAELVGSMPLPEDRIYGDLLSPMELRKTGLGGSGGGRPLPEGDGQTRQRTVRENKHIEAAVGVVGELCAYRHLQKRFPTACSMDSWKSENRMYRFGGEQGNDQLGYDFEITHNRKTFHIEVKATRGTDPQFEMGSSEQRRAIEDAGKRTTEFIVLFITNVFDRPEFHWLSNPYSSGNKESYRIREAGARVSFGWPQKKGNATTVTTRDTKRKDDSDPPTKRED